MKLILTSALTATIAAAMATSAFADTSDRYKDLRLDTSSFGQISAPAQDRYGLVTDRSLVAPDMQRSFTVTFSSRNKARKTRGTKGEGFIYGGFGRYNDSR